MHVAHRLLLPLSLLALGGCSDASNSAGGSASAAAAKSAAPKTTATAATTASAAPAPTASAAPREDCPKDSAGPGTVEQPCAGKGSARMMEVKWNGKIDDEKGPSFVIKNKAPKPVLYGKIAVFFYDKDGKQLEVAPEEESPDKKPRPYLTCAGTNLFQGIMKVDESATITFSCVKKKHVPEGTAAIEGELVMVGFADASEKKSEYFWANKDLAPDARPKGGVK